MGPTTWGDVRRRLRAINPGERRLREQVIATLVDLGLALPPTDLELLKRGLDRLPRVDPDCPSPAALAAARARNRVRVLEGRARLLADCLPAATVARGLGVSRQRLHQRRRDGRLLALTLPGPRGSLYPAWQFAEDGGIVAGLERVLAAAREAELGPEALHALMSAPSDRLGGAVPADLLARGDADRIAALIRSAGLGPFA